MLYYFSLWLLLITDNTSISVYMVYVCNHGDDATHRSYYIRLNHRHLRPESGWPGWFKVNLHEYTLLLFCYM